VVKIAKSTSDIDGGVMRLQTFFLAALIGSFSVALPAQAKVESQVSSTFQAADTALDLASSMNGKHVFVLSKGTVSIFTRDGKLQDTISVDPTFNRISVSGLDLANLEDKIFLSSEATGLVQEISYSFIVDIDVTEAPFLGMPDAPVVVAVYSDFQ
jgi:hypothetical protein